MNMLLTGRLPRLLALLCAVALLTLLSQAALAQTDTGRIVGTVTDQNGAIVPGAGVVIRNNATGEERTAVTTDEGIFTVSALKASFYTVSVQGNGLTARVENAKVAAGQELNLPVTLQPGGVSATVDVSAGTSEAAIDTSSARMGANVNQREVEGLPINGRQLSQLYLQAPGSVNTGSGTFGDIRFSGRAVVWLPLESISKRWSTSATGSLKDRDGRI